MSSVLMIGQRCAKLENAPGKPIFLSINHQLINDHTSIKILSIHIIRMG